MFLDPAWKNGAKMDAWGECFSIAAWRRAFEEHGFSISAYAMHEYSTEETLPWDTVDVGVTKQYYIRELERAKQAQTTRDCRKGCTGCGMMSLCRKEVKD